MDFENDIKCFVVRKSPVNNDDTNANASNAAVNNEKVKSIQITSSPESSEDEASPQLQENSNNLDMAKQKTRINGNEMNNNKINSVVRIPFSKEAIDFRNCYEFLGLQNNSIENSCDEKVEDGDKDIIINEPVEDKFEPSINIQSEVNCLKFIEDDCKAPIMQLEVDSPRRSQRRKSSLKVNFKRVIQKQRQIQKQKERYQDFKRYKEKLREQVPKHLMPGKFNTSILVQGATQCCLELQVEVRLEVYFLLHLILVTHMICPIQKDENDIMYWKEERRNSQLKDKLLKLEADNSCWPYKVAVSSDRIIITKIVDKFVF